MTTSAVKTELLELPVPSAIGATGASVAEAVGDCTAKTIADIRIKPVTARFIGCPPSRIECSTQRRHSTPN
ncbi:hypothetical protein ACFYUD_26055 [Nocardia tengchongensis]|uniref:hypothetical protein n=1 Tax=Nocardia tengchongensis TaxID=2055889 RepID=UPI0036C4B1E5